MRLALFLALASIFDGPTRPDDPKPAISPVVGSPEAKARFDALVACYRSLPAYADHGEVVVITQVGEKTIRRSQRASIAFVRPNKLDVETDLVRLVSDGATVTESNIPSKKYRALPVPDPFRETAFRGGAIGSIEFGGMAGLPLAHILNLVIGVEPERLVADFAPKLLVEPDQTIEGVPYQVLRFDEADNHDWRFLIDPKTGLVAHVDLTIEGDAAKSSIAGPNVHVASIRWSAGAISTSPPDPSAFRYKPPEGFTPVAPLDAPKPQEP